MVDGKKGFHLTFLAMKSYTKMTKYILNFDLGGLRGHYGRRKERFSFDIIIM
jgi:hypothetical protein